MRKWGVFVTGCYALVVLILFSPVVVAVSGMDGEGFLANVKNFYGAWWTWLFAGILVGSEALLLFLTVDPSFRKLRPRAHIVLSCLTAGVLTAILTAAVLYCIGFGIRGDAAFKMPIFGEDVGALGGTLWVFWTVVFYLYARNASEFLSRFVSWLMKGSVLELLVAVPCHVIVRRRHDCSAPVATAWGISTGIALMLLSFGPGVLLLYKRRLESREMRGKAAAAGS